MLPPPAAGAGPGPGSGSARRRAGGLEAVIFIWSSLLSFFLFKNVCFIRDLWVKQVFKRAVVGSNRACPKCSRRGAPEISRASSCSNDGPCTLAWCIKLARGMFLCTHHLDCGCCFTLSAEYFWAPATGRQGWPARAWRRGLDTAAAGWGAGGRIAFLQYDLVLLCSDKKCVSFA